MKTKYVSKSLFPYVFDSSALIDIERKRLIRHLRKRHSDVILPEKVSEEVKQPGSPLKNFIDSYPQIVIPFNSSEEDRYLEIRGQPGIDDGEAAAITLALSRSLPLVIGDKKGRSKAENHGIHSLTWQEFLQGY